MSGLYGNWGAVNIFLRNLARTDNKAHVLQGIGQLIAERIRQNILKQRLNFAPLVEEYAARKVGEGYDPRILIKTGKFVDSIVVKDVSVSGGELHVFIGVQDGDTETGVSLEELSYYIEYGTFKQPGRFPITNSWEEMRARVSNELIQSIGVSLWEGI